jgi:hypothetical protein
MYYSREPPRAPPKLILGDIPTNTTDVTTEKLGRFMEEKAKPRQPKSRWGGWSSYSDEPEGKETIASIGKLLPALFLEMISISTDLNESSDACKSVVTEIGNMKKHLPFKRVTTKELEKVTVEALNTFFETKYPHDFDDESFEIARFVEAFKYSENLEKWISTLCKRREVDARDVVVESFKKTIFKTHVVKKIFGQIQSESEMEMTDSTRCLLQCICFGINYDYTQLNDVTLKELGKRFVE